jgi:hypothetical protein
VEGGSRHHLNLGVILMALNTTPSRAAASYDTELSATIPMMQREMLDWTSKFACPTLKIFLANEKEIEFGPDGMYRPNFAYNIGDVRAMKRTQTFTTGSKEIASQLAWDTKLFYAAESINEIEKRRYSRPDKSMIPLAEEKITQMNNGLTMWMDYCLFSDWSEAEVATNQYINMATHLSSAPIPPDTYFRDLLEHNNRIYSIPMMARPYNVSYPYTLGNVSSNNTQWRPQYTDATGATVTRDTTAYNAETHEQTQIVTAIANSVDFDFTDIQAHARKLVWGIGQEYICPMPANLYDALENYLKASTERRTNDTPLLDLGIEASIKWLSRNMTFYVEPMMDFLWPNSIFFINLDTCYLIADPANNPQVNPWEKLQNSTELVTSVYFEKQLIKEHALSVSSMNGYTTTG